MMVRRVTRRRRIDAEPAALSGERCKGVNFACFSAVIVASELLSAI
jgi:hypothetical protein